MSGIKESITKACESVEAMNKAMNETMKQTDGFATGGIVSKDVFSNFVTHDCNCSVDTIALNKAFINAKNRSELELIGKEVIYMTKTELMESHTFEELAEMNVKQKEIISELYEKLNNSQGTVLNQHARELIHNGIIYVPKEWNDNIVAQFKERREESRAIKQNLNDKIVHLESIIKSQQAEEDTSIDMLNNLKDENHKLDLTIDVLLEKLKGK